MATAVALLTAGGIVAATNTADAKPPTREAAGCRPDRPIGSGVGGLLAGQDRAQPSAGAGRRGAGGAAAPPAADRGPGERNNRRQQRRQDRKDAAVEFPGRNKAGGPARRDFVSIQQVKPDLKRVEPRSAASTGTFTSLCGTNPEGHRNSDNFMVAPGKRNGAQHVHDYVGNRSTTAFSTDESLHAAGTTCTNGDQSTYFWPVLRNTAARGDDGKVDGGGLDGNVGEILRPVTAQLQFRGNPTSRVTPMPDDLTIITGDAKAATNRGDDGNAAWTCTGFADRTTTKYPLCPSGSRLVRILDFPSCWDGENLDSADHRSHIAFPRRDGTCGRGRVAIPQLRMTLTYDQPADRQFALDSFPDQRHSAETDHADFMAIMPEALLAQMADCINTGKTC